MPMSPSLQSVSVFCCFVPVVRLNEATGKVLELYLVALVQSGEQLPAAADDAAILCTFS